MALRVLAPNAIRPIEDLVPLLYPGVKVSYGTIQQILVEAEARAARFNAIRPIEDLVPLLYPGVKVSYGTIQQMLVEAEAGLTRRGRGWGAR